MKDRFKTLSLLLFNLLQLLYVLNPVSKNKLETQLSPKKKKPNNFHALGFSESRPWHHLQCGGNLGVRRTWTAALGLLGSLSSFSCELVLPVLLPGAPMLLLSFPSSSFLVHLARKRRGILLTHWICLLQAKGAFTFPFHTTDNFSWAVVMEVMPFKERDV